MPRSEIVIRVFVASPSDVNEERASLESVIGEVNSAIYHLGVRLELIKWETNTYPEFGQDPQDVINRQIQDNYDIFIGVLWGRFGTPTKRAQSGTQEEFERAYTKWKSDPESVDVMIYFKEEAIPRRNIDTNQINLVDEFRDGLGDLGGLYWTFQSSNDFEVTLRAHLNQVAHKWKNKLLPEDSIVISNLDNQNQELEDSTLEFGLLDYYEKIMSCSENIGHSLKTIGDGLYDITDQVNRRSQELNATGQIKDSEALKKYQFIINSLSYRISSFSKVVNNQIPVFSENKNSLFDDLSNMLLLLDEFTDIENSSEQYSGLENVLDFLCRNIEESMTAFSVLRDAVKSLPNISKIFNKSRKEMITALDRCLKEFESTLTLSENIKKSVNQKIFDT
jgi:Domain of unknown function (DUF4062)